MALTDIVAPPGDTGASLHNRGNVGVLVDIQAKAQNELLIPEVVSEGTGSFISIINE